LFDIELFEKVATTNTDNVNSVHPAPQAEFVFRTIANDFKSSMFLAKIGEGHLKRYLSSRYHVRLAHKMCALYDWSA